MKKLWNKNIYTYIYCLSVWCDKISEPKLLHLTLLVPSGTEWNDMYDRVGAFMTPQVNFLSAYTTNLKLRQNDNSPYYYHNNNKKNWKFIFNNGPLGIVGTGYVDDIWFSPSDFKLPVQNLYKLF